MAKKENTVIIALRCEVCQNKNYTTRKSKLMQEKIENKKFCPHCKKHTLHQEAKVK